MPETKHNVKLTVWLPLAILLLFFLDISLGSVYIPITDIFDILIGLDSTEASWSIIIKKFRLPRAVTAMAVGAGLAISGLQMQTLFRNPLAGPFVLGISSGASLGVALLMLAGGLFTSTLLVGDLGNWAVVLAASLGSALVLLLVLAVSVKVRDSMALLIIGLMFGSLTGAIVSVLQYFSTGDEIQVYLFWTFGSLGGVNSSELLTMVIIVIIGLLLSIFLIKPLNALLLSENYAMSMGIDIKKSRLIIIASTSLLAGSITAFCGPIAFVGLAVPHLARLLFDTSDHKILLPAVGLTGIIVMLVCDIISQIPGSDTILPINAVTSLLGAPVVIWIILSKGNLKNSFS